MITLGTIKGVVDIIASLSKVPTTRKWSGKTMFNDVLAPLHLEMDKIRESYMGIFETFRRNLKKARSPKEIRAAIEQFIEDREPVVLVRAKVRSGLTDRTLDIWWKKTHESIWAHEQDDEVREQLWSLIVHTHAFFEPGRIGGSRASTLVHEIKKLEAMTDEDLRRITPKAVPLLIDAIDVMLRQMTIAWERASQAYQAIKLHYS